MLQSVNNLRALVRPEAGLGVLAVLAAAAVVYLFMETQRTGAEASELEERVASARQTYDSLIGDEATLKNELEELESSQEHRAFPSRADALEFRKALTTYIAEQDLTVTALNTAQTTATLGDVEYKAVSYTVAARSNANALIGLLYLVDDVPSGVVQTLVLSRDPDSSAQWLMDLGVAVLYEE